MRLNQELDHWLRVFAKEFIQNRTKDILKRDIRNTDALLRSLQARVINEPEQGVFVMLVFAKTYGRYQDMRRTYTKAGGDEMIQLLEEWVGKEGVAKFRRGRYAQRFAGLTDQQVANRVAWGITQKLKRIPGTKKRGWWNRGKTRDIENFYDLILRVAQEAIVHEMKNA